MNTDKAWEVYERLVDSYFKRGDAEKLPTSYKEALQDLLAQVEANEQLQLENKEMKPKAEYFDALVDKKLNTTIRDTAKELQIRERRFVAFLLDDKFVYRGGDNKLKPYAEYAESGKGLFSLKDVYNRHNEWCGVQTYVTPKGKETFRLLLQEKE